MWLWRFHDGICNLRMTARAEEMILFAFLNLASTEHILKKSRRDLCKQIGDPSHCWHCRLPFESFLSHPVKNKQDRA